MTGDTFENLADDAPVLLAALDADGHCTWCNRPWQELTGHTLDRQHGDGWVSFVHPDDQHRVAALARRPFPFETELRLRRADGRYRWLLARGAPRQNSAARFAGQVLSATDVTEWRENEKLLRFLAALGEALSSSLELDEMLQGVAVLTVPDLADLCTVAIVDDDGRIRRAAVRDRERDREDAVRRLEQETAIEATAEDSAIGLVVRTGMPLHLPFVDAADPDEPWPKVPEARDGMQTRSLICVPLRMRAAVLGALCLVSRSRRYTGDDVALVQEVALRCATALDNAGLYRRSEDARTRLALLASIGEQLAATLDPRETIRTVVRQVVPVFADVAAIALTRPDGDLTHADLCHFDATREREYRERFADSTIASQSSTSVAQAFRSRRPVLIEKFEGECGRDVPQVTSVASVPLIGTEGLLGVITFAFGESDRRYRTSDLPLALDIARRATLAIERARAYDQERRLAETLQRSLLPDALPDVPGVTLCARYLPGGNVDVGGDWYDVVSLPGNRYGLAIGDVAGHGVRAATVMGQLRNVLRAFAAEGYEAAETVRRLNRFVFDHGPIDMATLCYAVLDPRLGTLECASAGHLPPLLMRPGAAPTYVHGRPAPPIGADSRTRYQSSEVQLEPGASLLLFTDGLVERRGESLDVGLNRLVDSVRDPRHSLDEMCDEALAGMLGNRRPSDDVAILGLRFLGAHRGPMRVRRPARATELAPVRRVLSAWLEASGVQPQEISAVSVAVSEAATNAIEHAYGPGEGWFEVEAEVDAQTLTVRVRDAGRWRPKARGGGGRGLGLIARLMDEFELHRTDNGTEVWMRRRLDGERKRA